MESLRLLAFRALLRLKLLYRRAAHYYFGSPQALTYLEWSTTDIMKPYDTLWSSYHRFFYRRGYTLWRRKSTPSTAQVPPNDHPRTPDGFSYETTNSVACEPYFYFSNPKIHAARTKDNRDVVILLLSDGVAGLNALNALKTVGIGVIASVDRNHTLPVLEFLHHGNLTFGVFPMVGWLSTHPWFGCMGEALEYMNQIMEGVAFLHDRRVVHRDLFPSNFLSSRRDPNDRAKDFGRPRYYIIDFEWAIHFPSDLGPAECKVVGPPLPWNSYIRPAPPEMISNQPHCPFKSDVWQLGYTFLEYFQDIEGIPELVMLLQLMSSDCPDTRPTARDAVDRLNELRPGIPSNILRQPIEEPEGRDWAMRNDEAQDAS